MKGFSSEPLNRDLPGGSVDIMGEDKFDRLQELGASLATGKDLSAEDKKEYYDLHNKFIAAVEHPANTANVITEREKNSYDSVDVEKIESQDSVEHPAVATIGRRKFERLQTLEVMRKLLGGHLLGDDEKEYSILNSEFHSAFLEYQRNEANTAPSPITFESPVEIYTEDDVLKWKNGAQRFEEFSNDIRDALIQEKFEAVFNPIDTNALKALFLKEKPVVLLGPGFDPTDSYIAPVIKFLKSFGIGTVDKYVYDKEQVQHVLETHKEIFEAFNSTDPDEIMNLIANGNSGNNHLAIGLLLGFPFKSVESFERREGKQREMMMSKPQYVNVYGIHWADFEDSLESRIKQARLKAAFELSGVLGL